MRLTAILLLVLAGCVDTVVNTDQDISCSAQGTCGAPTPPAFVPPFGGGLNFDCVLGTSSSKCRPIWQGGGIFDIRTTCVATTETAAFDAVIPDQVSDGTQIDPFQSAPVAHTCVIRLQEKDGTVRGEVTRTFLS